MDRRRLVLKQTSAENSRSVRSRLGACFSTSGSGVSDQVLFFNRELYSSVIADCDCFASGQEIASLKLTGS